MSILTDKPHQTYKLSGVYKFDGRCGKQAGITHCHLRPGRNVQKHTILKIFVQPNSEFLRYNHRSIAESKAGKIALRQTIGAGRHCIPPEVNSMKRACRYLSKINAAEWMACKCVTITQYIFSVRQLIPTARLAYQDSRFSPPARLSHVEVFLNSQAVLKLESVPALIAYGPIK